MIHELDAEPYTNNGSQCISLTHPVREALRCGPQPQHLLASNAIENDDEDGWAFLCRSHRLDATTYYRCLLGNTLYE